MFDVQELISTINYPNARNRWSLNHVISKKISVLFGTSIFRILNRFLSNIRQLAFFAFFIVI